MFRGTSPLSRRSLKSKGGRKRQHTPTRNLRQENYCSVQCLQSNQLSIFRAEATILLVEDFPEDVRPDLVLSVTKPKTWEQLAQGDLARERHEEVVNLPETAKLATVR